MKRMKRRFLENQVMTKIKKNLIKILKKRTFRLFRKNNLKKKNL